MTEANDTSVRGAARPVPVDGARLADLVRARTRALARAVKSCRRALAAEPDLAVEDVHALRVAARRAMVAIELAIEAAPGSVGASFVRRVARVRTLAGRLRDADVCAGLLSTLVDHATPEAGEVYRAIQDALAPARARAAAKLLRRLERTRARRWRRAGKRAARALPAPSASAWSIGPRLEAEGARLLEAAARDLTRPEHLHDLRLAIKHARDVVEALAPDGEARTSLADTLRSMQDRFGGVRDARVLAERLSALARGGATGGASDPRLARASERADALHARRAGEALAWWLQQDVRGLVARLGRAGAAENEAACSPPSPPDPPASPGEAERFAALDVGSNSIRLVIAQTRGSGRYRVLDDEREMARLGRGLAREGALDEASMAQAVEAISRMREIARGYRVSAFRAIATSAVREASNGSEFVERVRVRAGVGLEVIDAKEEGRLAFVSAAHALDLSDLAAGVCDIGGGSMQLVLAQRGVVEDVLDAPLGAVRLTERFGGPEEASGSRFKEMRAFVRRLVAETIGTPAFVPQVLVGTGGTFTTLGALTLARERPGGAEGEATPPVQGLEVARSQVSHALDALRGMSTRARARVPGLPSERADIIVAGLCVADEILDRLGINRVLIHERGIRDGLLLRMIGERFPPEGPVDRPTTARAFARACRYEERHSEHVARLALRLHEQFASSVGQGEAWAGAEARELLEAGAILHDIGYLINYEQHHKHAYQLIVNGPLEAGGGRGFSAREVEVIANLARYHRRKTPHLDHPGFAKLGEPDRELVRRLGGILRIADGLDRTHTQRVRDVRVEIRRGEKRPIAVLHVEAEDDPATDVWGADTKGDLFRESFGMDLRFEAHAVAPATP